MKMFYRLSVPLLTIRRHNFFLPDAVWMPYPQTPNASDADGPLAQFFQMLPSQPSLGLPHNTQALRAIAKRGAARAARPDYVWQSSVGREISMSHSFVILCKY